MNLKDILKNILEIFRNVGEREWTSVFDNFLKEIEVSDKKKLKRKILKIYGGMGSFNDLVLYREGRLCYKENVELDKLRKKLYNEITN
ncbi:DUF6966 domain-containing protein [Cochleicola gelatinilyticus]|uniref:DUF6966 domain-containing protein n=1 Tax=Cochleicola gelatinilyticus TaxID=1763537 RepID=A0A167HL33_9FLAO|nr:hypothetical protein [Cochleicola gelatinilyticus]OAB78726.1 hypothetical protein ULVI_09090 [Cochleicola gelatinilyticus]